MQVGCCGDASFFMRSMAWLCGWCRRKDEWWRVAIHVNSTLNFFLGGVGGFFAFQRFQHLALLINIILVTFCGMVHTMYIAYHENLSVFDVLEAKDE